MASTPKNGKKPVNTANTPKGKPPARPPLKTGLRREIVAIILGFCAIFLMVSLLGFGGALGRGISALFLGLIGIGAFILPFVLIGLAALYFMNRQNLVSKGRAIMSIILITIIISLTHMIGPTPYESFGQVFGYGAWSNGGLLGASISSLFIWMMGRVLTYVLFITLCAILFIVITGQSIFAVLRDSAKYVRDKGHEIRTKSDERKAREAEEEQEVYDYTPNYNVGARSTRPHTSAADLIFPSDDDEDENEIDQPEISNIEPYIPKSITSPIRNPIYDPRPTPPSASEANPRHSAPDAQPPQPPPAPIPAPIIEPEQQEEFTIDIKGLIEDAPPSYEPIQQEEPEEEPEGESETTPPWETEEKTAPSPPNSPLSTLHSPLPEYIFPPVELLRENTYTPSLSSRAQILENSKKLEETLASFGVKAQVVEVSKGPTVTRYELSPGSGVKVSKISGLADDLALNLAAETIRVEAPIPGKSVVGIEIPNKDVQAVYLREVIDDESFWSHPSKVSFAMGKDIAGNIVVADLARMPHLLIAGSTGSGKSVCINTLITSIIYKATPSEVKLLMIDPKVVELSVYNGIPHLLIPVVTDPKKASGALAWAVREMENRYAQFAETRVRDLAGYNAHLAEAGQEKLPQVVIIIDELADLMMTCGKEVEESICRLAQKARAAGIHLIVATQRPSVDVITGLIKANVPSRLAFAVSSGTDSRTILDMTGAEKLLGKGDMLFSPVGMSKPRRIQGSFISDKEVENIVDFIKQDGGIEYSEEMIEKITAAPEETDFSDESDPLIDDALAFLVEKEKASTSMLQRKFRIGYNRAARMIEELESRGLVGPEEGAKPRKVMMTSYQHREYVQRRQETIDASIKSGSGDF
ncbi:MAG: DNA translocase FtsK [Defluviitaleaceae bacterium]|nr:DNA translocase FtsK [Defluviitaleaceae bacterium]